ncbi:MAG: hypothetical protein FWF75_04755, partial [Propionibacteriaceae bacterium]|nr:hypothetical protein [Propionibacteriaceae bacterium]
TICLSGSGTIDHVVNGIGGTATQATVSTGQNVITYGAVETTRTITYQGAGDATPAAVTQPVIWEDYVLGGAAAVHTYVPQSDGYAAVTTPVIPGYDVDVASVPAEDVATTTTAPTNPDAVTVTYTPQTQKANVVWVDDDTEGSPTVATTTLSGPTGSGVGFTADDAAAGAPAGYEVASIDNVATYDTDPATDQTITVHLTHHHTVTSLTTTRTITFTGASAAPAPVTQSMTWAVDTDDVTKAVTYTSQAGYPAVTVPAITGFSSSASTVAAGAVSSATLPTDSSVTVTYSGLPQSLRVTWVDDDADGEAVGTPVYLGGPSESEVGFTAADAAAGAPEGYDVASIDNVATYDTAQAVMQNIVVHLTHHHTIGSLTTTRTVQFTGVSGAPESVVQTQTWTVDTDEVTGDVVFSSEAGYAAVDVPAIEHATPSVTQVPATGAVAATDELPANTVYTVTYTAEQAPIVSAGPGGSGTGTGSGAGANAPTGGSVVGGNAGALGAMLLLAVAGCGVALVRRSVVRG